MEIVVAVQKEEVVFNCNLCDQAVDGAPYCQSFLATLEKYFGRFGKGVDGVFRVEELLASEVLPEPIILFFRSSSLEHLLENMW